MPRVVSKEELLAMAGVDCGPSEWLRVDQERIDRFADATGDHQFIHVDPERAARSAFGATIAHGYLTLSLLPRLLAAVTPVPAGAAMAVNYGLDRVRFLAPVETGSEVRARSRILRAVEKDGGGVLVAREVTVEIRGLEKPALVAETLTLYVIGASPPDPLPHGRAEAASLARQQTNPKEQRE